MSIVPEAKDIVYEKRFDLSNVVGWNEQSDMPSLNVDEALKGNPFKQPDVSSLQPVTPENIRHARKGHLLQGRPIHQSTQFPSKDIAKHATCSETCHCGAMSTMCNCNKSCTLKPEYQHDPIPSDYQEPKLYARPFFENHPAHAIDTKKWDQPGLKHRCDGTCQHHIKSHDYLIGGSRPGGVSPIGYERHDQAASVPDTPRMKPTDYGIRYAYPPSQLRLYEHTIKNNSTKRGCSSCPNKSCGSCPGSNKPKVDPKVPQQKPHPVETIHKETLGAEHAKDRSERNIFANPKIYMPKGVHVPVIEGFGNQNSGYDKIIRTCLLIGMLVVIIVLLSRQNSSLGSL